MAVQSGAKTYQLDVGRLDIRRFSLDEYHQLVEIGFLYEDEPVELIEGVLHSKDRQSPPHAQSRRRLASSIFDQLIERTTVRIGDPITIPSSDSEPEPDLMLIVPREGSYVDRHPLPEEVLLVVEVADTSLENDREIKLPVYAAAGIEDYWIVNLVDNQVEVYRQPAVLTDGTATYRQRTVHVAGDTIAPLHFPDCAIDVRPLLP